MEGSMFQPGDYVFVKDSAQEDIGSLAWLYVQHNRKAQVVCEFHMASSKPIPANEVLYCVVWPEQFEGGWHCWHQCLPGYGQMVAAKNLELLFEESREVVTMPNLNAPDREIDR